MHFLWGNSY